MSAYTSITATLWILRQCTRCISLSLLMSQSDCLGPAAIARIGHSAIPLGIDHQVAGRGPGTTPTIAGDVSPCPPSVDRVFPIGLRVFGSCQGAQNGQSCAATPTWQT
jgi:hypothetical protein